MLGRWLLQECACSPSLGPWVPTLELAYKVWWHKLVSLVLGKQRQEDLQGSLTRQSDLVGKLQDNESDSLPLLLLLSLSVSPLPNSGQCLKNNTKD